MEIEEFYNCAAELLQTDHDYSDPLPVPVAPCYDGSIRNTYKNRWNGRDPGNGRFPGHGLIRHFGTVIHVNLYNPPLSGFFATTDEALTAIESAINRSKARVHDEEQSVV